MPEKLRYVAVETYGTVIFPKRPPDYWWREKEQKGVEAAGIASIWYRRYSPEKRFVVWMDASDTEWSEHGLARPTVRAS